MEILLRAYWIDCHFFAGVACLGLEVVVADAVSCCVGSKTRLGSVVAAVDAECWPTT